MIPVGVGAAVLSALCYGVTPACARRSIRLLGFARANVWRLVVALAVIGALAFTVGRGIGDEAATFALAGAVGLGLGGFAMFRALPLLGAPLASLVVETTAAVVAGVLAWVWFADAVSIPGAAFSLIILAGVVIGLLPYVRGVERQPRLRLGLLFALLSALAQAFSAVLSRKALLATQQAANARGGGVKVGSSFEFVFSAAFDRLVGGLAVALALLALAILLARRAEWARASLTPAARGAERGAVWTTPDARLGLGPWAPGPTVVLGRRERAVRPHPGRDVDDLGVAVPAAGGGPSDRGAGPAHRHPVRPMDRGIPTAGQVRHRRPDRRVGAGRVGAVLRSSQGTRVTSRTRAWSGTSYDVRIPVVDRALPDIVTPLGATSQGGRPMPGAGQSAERQPRPTTAAQKSMPSGAGDVLDVRD